jgi:hypothetical protein
MESRIQTETTVEGRIELTLMNGDRIHIESQFEVATNYSIQLQAPKIWFQEPLDKIREQVLIWYPDALCYTKLVGLKYVIRSQNKDLGFGDTEQEAWEGVLEWIRDAQHGLLENKEFVQSHDPAAYLRVTNKGGEIRTARGILLGSGNTEHEAWEAAASRIKVNQQQNWELR